MPIFQASMPVIKTLLENLVVPALVAVIDTVNNLFKGIKLAYDIVKGFYEVFFHRKPSFPEMP